MKMAVAEKTLSETGRMEERYLLHASKCEVYRDARQGRERYIDKAMDPRR